MALSSDSVRTTLTPSRHFSVSGIVNPLMVGPVYQLEHDNAVGPAIKRSCLSQSSNDQGLG
jgi:hypothetical protein